MSLAKIELKDAVSASSNVPTLSREGYGFSKSIYSCESSPLLEPNKLDAMMKLADIMSKSSTIPAFLQGKPGDCLRIIEFSYRIKQSPYAIADCCFFYQGKMSMEGKLIAAIINSSDVMEGSLQYEYSGDIKSPASFFCKITGKKKGEQPNSMEISLQEAITAVTKYKDGKPFVNAHWKTIPEQALTYYASRMWARRYAPEIIMGLYSIDEMQDVNYIPEKQLETLTEVEPNEEESLKHDFLKTLIKECSTVQHLVEMKPELTKFKESTTQLKMADELKTLFIEKHRELSKGQSQADNLAEKLNKGD